jgi:hypothetical protein
MRTTIRINDELLRKAKIRAAETSRSLTQVIEDALRREIDNAEGIGKPEKISIPTAGEGGVQSGVDLDDTSSLLDKMEGIT